MLGKRSLIGAVALILGLAASPALAGGYQVEAPARRVTRAMLVRGLPDLVIESASLSPARECRPGAPALYVRARVRNNGNAASAAKSGVGMVQARDAGGVNWGNGHGLPAIAPGQTVSVNFPVYYLQSKPAYMLGTHAFRLTVNAGKWIRESNYANNDYGKVNVTLPPGSCGLRPDIASRKGPRIGGKYVPWGGSVTLGRKNAKRIQNGHCVFDFVYTMVDQGKTDTSPQFVNRLRANRTLLAVNSGLHLRAGQTQTLDTEPRMPVGRYTISVSLDDGHAVAESNENNNIYRVHVDVDNTCGISERMLRPMKPKMMLRHLPHPSASIR